MDSDSVKCSSDGNKSVQPTSQRNYHVVVAATPNMGIGKDGKLPWRLPGDLKFFKDITSTTSDPTKRNAVTMGRKTWESIPTKFRPLPGCLNVVLTRSGSFEISTANDVMFADSIPSALKLLAEPPYSFSIEKVFLIGGGQKLRDGLNGPECEAIHITEIKTPIQCDTFIPPIDMSIFQPWYSSSPAVENEVRYCFVTYVRLRTSTSCSGSTSLSKRFKLLDFSFLLKIIFEKHEEFLYLRLVQDIISNGNNKDDRTGTGTLSKFGCQMHFNLRKSFPLLTTKV